MEVMRALYHWLRLRYYTFALEHVGVDHPDAAELVMHAALSQRVVEDFLYARSRA